MSAYKGACYVSSLEKLPAGDPSAESAFTGRWGCLRSALVTEKGERGRAASTKMELSPGFLGAGLLVQKMPKCIPLAIRLEIFLYVWVQEKLSKKRRLCYLQIKGTCDIV